MVRVISNSVVLPLTATVVLLLVGVLWSFHSRLAVNTQVPITPSTIQSPNPIDLANAAYNRGQYSVATKAYEQLRQIRPSMDVDFCRAAALSAFHDHNFSHAIQLLESIKTPDDDDLRLLVVCQIRAYQFAAAITISNRLDRDALEQDPELLEELAHIAQGIGDNAKAWRFYTLLKQNCPNWPGLKEMDASPEFNPSFFGYGPSSIANYLRGMRDGSVSNVRNSASATYKSIRHPRDTFWEIWAVHSIFTRDNLLLLFSPSLLTNKIGSVGARAFSKVWGTAIAATAEKYSLDRLSILDQQRLHEIAAGKCIGYVLPDVALIFLTGGLGDVTQATDDTAQVADVVSVSKDASQFTEDFDEATRNISAERFGPNDITTWPELSHIGWMSEETWEGLKSNTLLTQRLSPMLEKIDGVQEIPGIQRLVGRIRSCSNADQMEGHLLELSRAAQYKRDGQLDAIEKPFYVEMTPLGEPVQIRRGEADLALKDGTLVEIKHRRDSLQLDQAFRDQLDRYQRVAKDGKYQRLRIECDAPISQKVRDRCAEIIADGVGVELIELSK
jgi:tetratricopeptide (TPR) repeat protein